MTVKFDACVCMCVWIDKRFYSPAESGCLGEKVLMFYPWKNTILSPRKAESGSCSTEDGASCANLLIIHAVITSYIYVFPDDSWATSGSEGQSVTTLWKQRIWGHHWTTLRGGLSGEECWMEEPAVRSLLLQCCYSRTKEIRTTRLEHPVRIQRFWLRGECSLLSVCLSVCLPASLSLSLSLTHTHTQKPLPMCTFDRRPYKCMKFSLSFCVTKVTICGIWKAECLKTKLQSLILVASVSRWKASASARRWWCGNNYDSGWQPEWSEHELLILESCESKQIVTFLYFRDEFSEPCVSFSLLVGSFQKQHWKAKQNSNSRNRFLFQDWCDKSEDAKKIWLSRWLKSLLDEKKSPKLWVVKNLRSTDRALWDIVLCNPSWFEWPFCDTKGNLSPVRRGFQSKRLFFCSLERRAPKQLENQAFQAKECPS